MPLIIILILLVIFGVAALLLWPPLGDGNEYLPNDEEVRWLRATSVVEDEKGRKAFGRGSVELRGGLNVLKLHGSHYEMGFQHGALLREEIHRGPAPFYTRPIEHFSPFKHLNGILRFFLAKYFDWTIYRRLMQASPKEYLAELKGMADGSGLAFANVFRGNMLSDFNMNLIKVLEKKMLRKSGEAGWVAIPTMLAAASGIRTRL